MNSDYISFVPLLLILALLALVIATVTKKNRPRLNKKHFIKHWEEIEKMDNYSMAVLKADSLVDQALKHANIKGGTMGERLNHSVGLIKDINSVWEAHKLRNKIAHEHDSDPTMNECQRALRQLKRALKEIGAL